MKKDILVVLSGGIDSTTLLYDYAQRTALAVSFDYGSNHNARELECAREHCRRLGIEHLVIPLGFIGKYFNSSLLSGAEAIPTGDYDCENMSSTVVPFRNGIMLSVSIGLAESRGLERVMIANHGGDHDIYPDCRPDFIKAMDQAARKGTYPGIRVEGPYTFLTKAQIIERGARLGIDYSCTYSCYKGDEKHCGECGTCRERRQAFADANVADPTVYDN